jgi:uncharacterized membrane protein HdeD (DUF308 family)
LNTRLIIGIVLVILGVLVLVQPAFLAVIVGITLIIGGLWFALQNAPASGKI